VDKLFYYMATIITIHKASEDFNDEFFFSTDHCQPNLPDNYVPVTHYNTTREEVLDRNINHYPVVGCKSIEIPNPDPKYQA